MLTRSLQIGGYWSTAKSKPVDECIAALLRLLVFVDAAQCGAGQWRVMRNGPYTLGVEVELTSQGVGSLVLAGRSGWNDDGSDPTDDTFGYNFDLEYIGPQPMLVEGTVAMNLVNDNMKNSVLLKFRNGDESVERDPDIGFVEAVFEEVVAAWRPQFAVCSTSPWMFASEHPDIFFPYLGWLNYFGETAVVSLLEDLGVPFVDGLLVKAATECEDTNEVKIVELADELNRRGLSAVIYRET